jgi:hypothetical protein
LQIDIGIQLPKALDQVVGEGIVIINEENHGLVSGEW